MNSAMKNERHQLDLLRSVTMVYTHDLNGNFTSLNHDGELLSGYSSEEARRMNIAQVVPPEIAGFVREQMVRNVSKRIGTVYEIDLVAKDGRRVPLEVSTRVVLREGQSVEIEGIAVPSVLRSSSPSPEGLRCVDADFFFGS
jgi:two-component system cell cycle sensor histidine kinase/response regulator CckA